jgi:hypothetical protein
MCGRWAADCLHDLPSLGLDDQAADLFLHGNAERVFGLTGTHPRPREPAIRASRPGALQQTASLAPLSGRFLTARNSTATTERYRPPTLYFSTCLPWLTMPGRV